MTISRYKDLTILLLLGVIVILLFRFNDLNNHSAMLESDFVNEQAMHDADVEMFEEQIGLYEDSLEALKIRKAKEAIKWKKTPIKERIKYVSLIDSNSIVTDSTVCFTISGVDSINALAVNLKYCIQENVIKDGIITTQGDKISKDSIFINSQKKALKTEVIKGNKKGLIGVCVGLFIGLLLQ
jgi:hypothetical protein